MPKWTFGASFLLGSDAFSSSFIPQSHGMGSFCNIRLFLMNTSPVRPERGRELAWQKYAVSHSESIPTTSTRDSYLSGVFAQVAFARCTLLAQILEGYHSGWCLKMGPFGTIWGLELEVVVAGGEPWSNAAGHQGCPGARCCEDVLFTIFAAIFFYGVMM